MFYIVTYAKTNKVKQIEENPEVSIDVHMKKGTLRINHGEMFYHFDFDNRTAI